jgi:DNA-binding NtrC family response regulator
MPKSILLVDDEKDLIELFMEALKINGFQVSGYNDSVEAYNHFKQCPEKYGLVISDFRMPDMNGNELCNKLVALNPNLKIILMSAYENVEHNLNFIFVSKPILLTELLQLVRKNLTEEIDIISN